MSKTSIKPLVTCVISSYNHDKYIFKCIKSIINQDYHNIELIIIDDGSNDKSTIEINKLLQECKKRFVRFEYISQSNKGLTYNLNFALNWSKGEYFCSIGSDDYMLTNKTSVLVEEMLKAKNIGGVFGGCEVISENDNLIKKISPKNTKYDFYKIISRNYIIINPSQLLKTSILKKINGYPENLYIDDWYMWLLITNAGYELKVISDILVKYRQHHKNMSKNAYKMYESRKEILNLYKKHFYYSKALSDNELYASIDFSTHSKIIAFNHLIKSLKFKSTAIFTLKFYIALTRVVLPNFIIKILSSLKFIISNNLLNNQNRW